MTHDAIDAALFKVGDRVQKRSGYRFPGIVRSVYPKGDGEIRYDVEADHPAFAGMLHIFSEAQLEPREDSPPAPVASEEEIVEEMMEAWKDTYEAEYMADGTSKDNRATAMRAAFAVAKRYLEKQP